MLAHVFKISVQNSTTSINCLSNGRFLGNIRLCSIAILRSIVFDWHRLEKVYPIERNRINQTEICRNIRLIRLHLTIERQILGNIRLSFDCVRQSNRNHSIAFNCVQLIRRSIGSIDIVWKWSTYLMEYPKNTCQSDKYHKFDNQPVALAVNCQFIAIKIISNLFFGEKMSIFISTIFCGKNSHSMYALLKDLCQFWNYTDQI